MPSCALQLLCGGGDTGDRRQAASQTRDTFWLHAGLYQITGNTTPGIVRSMRPPL